MNDLNERVAREVMGWVRLDDGWYDADGYMKLRPNFTTYEGMGLVIERMRELKFDVSISVVQRGRPETRRYSALFYKYKPTAQGAEAETLPEAVALAALEAVSHD